MNLEIPKKFSPLINQAQQVAREVFRPISRKYDRAEHEYPKELDLFASIMDGMNDGAADGEVDHGGADRCAWRRGCLEPGNVASKHASRSVVSRVGHWSAVGAAALGLITVSTWHLSLIPT